MNAKTHRLPAVAQVLEAITLASSTGKVETLGSTFSNKTRIAKLLAFSATYREVIFLNVPS